MERQNLKNENRARIANRVLKGHTKKKMRTFIPQTPESQQGMYDVIVPATPEPDDIIPGTPPLSPRDFFIVPKKKVPKKIRKRIDSVLDKKGKGKAGLGPGFMFEKSSPLPHASQGLNTALDMLVDEEIIEHEKNIRSIAKKPMASGRVYGPKTKAQTMAVKRRRAAALTAARRRRAAIARNRRLYFNRGQRRGIISTPWSTLIGYGGYKSKYKDLQAKYEKDCYPSVGGRIGGFIGDQGQKLFTHLTGLGDYNIRQNSLYHGTDPPMIANTMGGEEVVVRHREFLGDLNSGPLDGAVTAFDLNFYAINPGNTKLFPFLANLAANYQEWELRGMVVELKTLSSDFASNSVLGSMFIGTQYNALTPAPNNKRELENLEYSTSGKPSGSIIHGIECARHLNVDTHLYVAIDSNYEGGDKRFFDLGTLFVGTQGLNVPNAPVAELWVSYECVLYKPRLQAPITKTWLAQQRGTAITDVFPWGYAPGQQIPSQPGSYDAVTATVDANAHFLLFGFPAIEASYLIQINHTTTTSETLTITTAADPGVSSTPTIYQPPGGGDFTDGTYESIQPGGQKSFSVLVSVNPQIITSVGIRYAVGFAFSAFTGNVNNGYTITVSSWNPKVQPI